MRIPSGKYAALTERALDAAFNTPGPTPAALRRQVLERAAQLGNRGASPLPGPVGTYVDKVALHAYKVTDADVAALKAAGHTDDAMFEVTVAAAVGAALARLERGLAALRARGGGNGA